MKIKNKKPSNVLSPKTGIIVRNTTTTGIKDKMNKIKQTKHRVLKLTEVWLLREFAEPRSLMQVSHETLMDEGMLFYLRHECLPLINA